MTETPDTGQSADTNAAPAAPVIRVLAQYVKDLSFENPGLFSAPQGAGPPEIELGIDVRVEPAPAPENIFAVELRLSAKAKRQENIVFIVELLYTGVFQ